MNIQNLFPGVENVLDWTAKRQQTLSANIANLDTPGYRAKDITFSEEMNNVQLSTTSGAHLQGTANSNMDIVEVEGDEKVNGNTVDLDREMTELTKNGLQYVTLIQYLNQKLRTLRSAVNDGGKA